MTFLHRQISQQSVYCMHREAGCTWTGELGMDEKNLSNHAQRCKYRETECPKCGEHMLVAETKKHTEMECGPEANKPPKKKASKKRKH
jgi:hypothetical protein